MKRIMCAVLVVLIFAMVETGLSSQAKEKWQDISYGIDEIDLKTIAVNPQLPDVIYVGSTKSIFKTLDNGKNWRKVHIIRGTFTSVNTLAIDPKNTDIVYAGTQNGLYKSIDGGTAWDRPFEGIGIQEKDIRHIMIELADTNRIYIGTSSGIFITEDAGATWNKLSNETSNQIINFIAQDPFDANIIYAAANTGVFKSKDGGLSFERIFIATAQTKDVEVDETSQDTNIDEVATSSNKTPNCIAIDGKNNNKLYIGTNSGVFVYDDAQKGWEKLTDSGLINNEVLSLASTKDDALYAATKKGVFKISSPYNNWDEIYNGLISKDTRYLAYNQATHSLLAVSKKGLYRLFVYPKYDIKDAPSPPNEEMAEILARFESEPSIQQTQEAAIGYAEVHKEKIEGWRKSVKQKAMLPKVSLGIDENKGDYYYSGTWRGRDQDTGWDVSLTWELGELIWNNDQNNIDVRSRLMVQLRDDILDEVTRTYFERRRLQIELLTSPPKNIQHRIEKELRLQELSAGIDALTGGWFSKRIEEAKY